MFKIFVSLCMLVVICMSVNLSNNRKVVQAAPMSTPTCTVLEDGSPVCMIHEEMTAIATNTLIPTSTPTPTIVVTIQPIDGCNVIKFCVYLPITRLSKSSGESNR